MALCIVALFKSIGVGKPVHVAPLAFTGVAFDPLVDFGVFTYEIITHDLAGQKLFTPTEGAAVWIAQVSLDVLIAHAVTALLMRVMRPE